MSETRRPAPMVPSPTARSNLLSGSYREPLKIEIQLKMRKNQAIIGMRMHTQSINLSGTKSTLK